ncbi:MAG: PriCT-2 domain-containing protein [Rhodospirillaceae bacterium]
MASIPPPPLNFMALYGARIADNGFCPIPVMPGTKKPGRYRNGAWGDYPEWTRHCSRQTTETEIRVWSTWQGAGVGIACGNVIGIDIDVHDPDAAIRIEQLARDMLGDTPLLRIGLAPKRMLIYSADRPFSGPRRGPLEVIAVNRQFVACAIHPVTNRPYVWPDGSPADVSVESLPVITEQSTMDWLVAAERLLPPASRPAATLGSIQRSTASHDRRDLRGTLEAVSEALGFIPNSDVDYDTWIRTGLALMGALGESGAELFASWSAQSSKNDPAATKKAWVSFKPKEIGAGTIYQLALNRGWQPDSGVVLDGGLLMGKQHPASGLLQRLESSPVIPDSSVFLDDSVGDRGDMSDFTLPRSPLSTFLAPPAEPAPPTSPAAQFTAPGGILGDLVAFQLATARRPQPELATAASLCALGALMGRRYRSDTDLRSNLYIIGVAESGSGKNHSREVISRLFHDAGLGHYLGNKLASGAGLLTALSEQPNLLLQLDEIGMWLSAIGDRRHASPQQVEILNYMTELYTSASGKFIGTTYSNRDGKNPRRDIDQPCLCIYGTTTPAVFWRALNSVSVVDGSLARMIIAYVSNDYPEENEARGIRVSPPALLESLRDIAGVGRRSNGANLYGLATTPPDGVPMTVLMDTSATDIFRALSRATTERLRAACGTPYSPIIARIVENATKVALIHAVSLDPEAPLIRAGDAEWAIQYVTQSADRTISEVERRVADNETERQHKRLAEIIRSAGSLGITKNDLTRRSQFVDRKKRDDLIAALVEGGLIAIETEPTATKKVTRLRYVVAGG